MILDCYMAILYIFSCAYIRNKSNCCPILVMIIDCYMSILYIFYFLLRTFLFLDSYSLVCCPILLFISWQLFFGLFISWQLFFGLLPHSCASFLCLYSFLFLDSYSLVCCPILVLHSCAYIRNKSIKVIFRPFFILWSSAPIWQFFPFGIVIWPWQFFPFFFPSC